ncbi:DUF2860 family protein [Hyphococcus luteus]|nr:DUF2860 family protein [Marinicaulis flavus]
MVKWSACRASGALVAGTLCLLGPALAQEPEESAREAADQGLMDVQRRAEESDTAREAAIPFEQILRAPEDIRLNIAYARQQIAAGDLKEAGATLERILLINPDLYDVRVLYGFVLYRLGLYDRARYELELALESGLLPSALAAEAEAYLNRIKYEQRRTRGSLTVTAGVDYDSNRNQAPSSGMLQFAIPNDPVNPTAYLEAIVPANQRNGDAAYVFSAQGRLLHDLGSQEGHMLHADVGYYRSDKVEVDTLDLDAATVAAGGTFYSGKWSFTPTARGSFYWLGGDDYLSSWGGEVRTAYRWNPKITSYGAVRVEDEKFRATSNFGAAYLRSGKRIGLRGGTKWRFSPTQAVQVEGLYMIKDGEVAFESYDRYGANVQHSWLLGRGAFSLIGLWAEKSEYDGNDPFIGPTVRDEWLYRARATLGVPFSFFFPKAPEGVKDINLIAQYEYETVDSNILNFDYKAHKAALLLSKRIAF